MVYYIGYIFHNPEAIKALREIEKGLWIDYPGKTSRMELREVPDGLILCTEADVYDVKTHAATNLLNHSGVYSIEITPSYFQVRVERDTAALISAIDKLNESKDPTLCLKSDPRDGIKLFIES